MSCRVIGRGVEYAFIKTIVKDLREQVDVVAINFSQTAKNEIVKPYLQNCGLTPDANTAYTGDIQDVLKQIPETYIEVRIK